MISNTHTHYWNILQIWLFERYDPLDHTSQTDFQNCSLGSIHGPCPSGSIIKLNHHWVQISTHIDRSFRIRNDLPTVVRLIKYTRWTAKPNSPADIPIWLHHRNETSTVSCIVNSWMRNIVIVPRIRVCRCQCTRDKDRIVRSYSNSIRFLRNERDGFYSGSHRQSTCAIGREPYNKSTISILTLSG